MASLTKRQKIMAAIMCLAAGAFVWDRSSSTPAPAAAAEAPPELLVTAPVAHNAKPLQEPSSLGLKLVELATAQHLDPAQAQSAFTLPETWPTLKKVEIPPATSRPAESDRTAADEFVRKHHLDAILVRAANSDSGVAIVDGQSVTVGHTFDHFRLMSVTQSTAVFRRGRIQLEMRLAPDSKLKRDGATIADSAPTPDE